MLTIERKFVGCHPSGYEVYRGWERLDWFPTMEEAVSAYPEAVTSSSYFTLPRKGEVR